LVDNSVDEQSLIITFLNAKEDLHDDPSPTINGECCPSPERADWHCRGEEIPVSPSTSK